MKKEEIEIMHQFNAYCLDSHEYLKMYPRSYSRFDAYNSEIIVEIKNRAKIYDGRLLIEFDKFSYNLKFSKIHNKKFLYVNRVDSNLFVFDINYLDYINYNFNWQWKALPKTTEFGNTELVDKYIGYVSIRDSDTIEMIEHLCPN
jgi:hypothetical protein